MKNNTYIIPAIDFYILKEPAELANGRGLNNAQVEHQFSELIVENPQLIPFSDVDGLTVSEMATVLHIRNYFAIIAVNESCEYSVVNHSMISSKNFSILDTVIFDTADRNILNKEMGKVFEDYIEAAYSDINHKQKRIYHSFLEKYQCQDYEQAKQKIKEIEENRK